MKEFFKWAILHLLKLWSKIKDVLCNYTLYRPLTYTFSIYISIFHITGLQYNKLSAHNVSNSGVIQKINILIMNQSVMDMLGSFLGLLNALVEVDGSHMSRDSAWDQFVCRIWMTRTPLWCLLLTSTYGIILTALERYLAVVYPIFYKVRLFIAAIFLYRPTFISDLKNITKAVVACSLCTFRVFHF